MLTSDCRNCNSDDIAKEEYIGTTVVITTKIVIGPGAKPLDQSHTARKYTQHVWITRGKHNNKVLFWNGVCRSRLWLIRYRFRLPPNRCSIESCCCSIFYPVKLTKIFLSFFHYWNIFCRANVFSNWPYNNSWGIWVKWGNQNLRYI